MQGNKHCNANFCPENVNIHWVMHRHYLRIWLLFYHSEMFNCSNYCNFFKRIFTPSKLERWLISCSWILNLDFRSHLTYCLLSSFDLILHLARVGKNLFFFSSAFFQDLSVHHQNLIIFFFSILWRVSLDFLRVSCCCCYDMHIIK